MGGAEVGEDPGEDGMVFPVMSPGGFGFYFLVCLIFHLIGDEASLFLWSFGTCFDIYHMGAFYVRKGVFYDWQGVIDLGDWGFCTHTSGYLGRTLSLMPSLDYRSRRRRSDESGLEMTRTSR